MDEDVEPSPGGAEGISPGREPREIFTRYFEAPEGRQGPAFLPPLRGSLIFFILDPGLTLRAILCRRPAAAPDGGSADSRLARKMGALERPSFKIDNSKFKIMN